MKTPRRRRLAGLAAIGAVALVAGCGGGSDDGASTPTTAAATTATTATATAAGTASTAPAPAVTDGTGTEPASGVVEPTRYLGDVQAAAGALSSFGTLLQSVSSPSDLTRKAPEARQRLDTFDTAIAKLDAYTLEDPRLERQRAGLARTGPRVSSTLRDFTDAAAKGDLAEIQRLIPEIRSAIGEFQSAATDVG